MLCLAMFSSSLFRLLCVFVFSYLSLHWLTFIEHPYLSQCPQLALLYQLRPSGWSVELSSQLLPWAISTTMPRICDATAQVTIVLCACRSMGMLLVPTNAVHGVMPAVLGASFVLQCCLFLYVNHGRYLCGLVPVVCARACT